jgi:hypothetical protein
LVLFSLGAAVAVVLVFAAQFSPGREQERTHTFAFARAESCPELICFAVYAVDVENLREDAAEEGHELRPGDTRKLASLSGGAWAIAFSDDGRTLLYLRASTTVVLPDGFVLDLWSVPVGGGNETLIQKSFVEWSPAMPPLGVLLGQSISHDAQRESGVSYRAVESSDGRYTAFHAFRVESGRLISNICVTEGGLGEINLAAARCFDDGNFGASDPVWIEH